MRKVFYLFYLILFFACQNNSPANKSNIVDSIQDAVINEKSFVTLGIVGLKLVEKYPEDYTAYFGITQVINLNKSIKLSREWIKKQAALKKDNVSLKILAQIDKDDTSICKRPLDCFLKQYELLSKYGGAIYRKESEAEI